MNEIKLRTVYLLRRTNKKDNGSDLYVGSTSKKLKERLYDHRGNAKRSNSKLYTRMAETGVKNWTIEPLLTFSCDKKTIYDFEKEWIRVIKPDLNLHSPVKENNEKDRERAREHYFESLKTRRYHCDVCDITFGKSNDLKRHLRSLKHSNNYMNSVD